MPFLSVEVSQRIQTAHPGGRQVMLHYLLPWMNNVELVDFKPVARRPDDCGSGEEDEESHEREIMMVNSRRWLRGEGWGSPKATTMVLNNLMFMTAKVKPQSHLLLILCHATKIFFFLQWFVFCFFMSVWRWVCMVRDWECVDHASRQLAKEPQNHLALPHKYVRSQQWPQPLVLCE